MTCEKHGFNDHYNVCDQCHADLVEDHDRLLAAVKEICEFIHGAISTVVGLQPTVEQLNLAREERRSGLIKDLQDFNAVLNALYNHIIHTVLPRDVVYNRRELPPPPGWKNPPPEWP